MFDSMFDPTEEIRQLKARVKELEQALEGQQADSAFLEALRAAGVDSWEGYEIAQESFNEV